MLYPKVRDIKHYKFSNSDFTTKSYGEVTKVKFL